MLLTAACGEETPRPTAVAAEGEITLDLIAEYPAATVTAETSVIDMGKPEARGHLLAGWDEDEEDADGSFVWSSGEASSLGFFAVEPTDFTLGLLCKPLVFEGAPEQTMTVELNGEPLAEVRMGRKLERYEIEVPARRVAGGQNRLGLRYGYHRRPRDVIPGAADERNLAVRCYEVTLRGLGTGTATTADGTADGRIVVPVGTQVSYYFDIGSSAELVIAGIEPWGPRADDARLLIRSRSEDSSAAVERLIDPGIDRYPLRIPLQTEGDSIDRLELATVLSRRSGSLDWMRRKLGMEDSASGLSPVLPAVRRLGPVSSDVAAGDPPDESASEPPNIVIYLIDTLRADHLGSYGYDRPTSPNIDRFAADSVLFSNAQAQSSWTRPTVVSLFTGLRPRIHGVNRRADALSRSIDTVSKHLARLGYQTAGFVTNGNVGPTFALDEGFDQYRHLRESADTIERHQQSDQLNRWLFHWLDNREDVSPFFLYAHATDPHAPYTPAEAFRRRFAADADPELGLLDTVRSIFAGRREASESDRQDLIDLYDAEIAFNDHHFGRLIGRLKELGLYQESLIVLLSDHGEEFLEHGGWEHGKTLYGEQLLVPLIVKLPGGRGAGKRIQTLANQVDVLPTILELLGAEVPAQLDGRSLLPTLDHDEGEATSYAYLSLSDRNVRSVLGRGWKLILDHSPHPHGEPTQLFRVAVDRGETRQLAAEHPFETEYLAQVLRRMELGLERRAALPEQVEIPDELREQLEALGYVN